MGGRGSGNAYRGLTTGDLRKRLDYANSVYQKHANIATKWAGHPKFNGMAEKSAKQAQGVSEEIKKIKAAIKWRERNGKV